MFIQLQHKEAKWTIKEQLRNRKVIRRLRYLLQLTKAQGSWRNIYGILRDKGFDSLTTYPGTHQALVQRVVDMWKRDQSKIVNSNWEIYHG